MPPEPVPFIAGIPSVIHGAVSPDEIEALGLDPADVVDFSASCNPLGIAPEVAAAAAAAPFDRYPPDAVPALRSAIAEMLAVAPSRVLVGAGTIDLLWMLTRAYLRPGDRGVVLGPSFGEYERAMRTCGAEVIEVRASPPDFSPPIEQAAAVARQSRARQLFVCAPNNPTGQNVGVEQLRRLAAACPDTLIIIDEAYSAFSAVPFQAGSLISFDNVCVLRSMTKDHALAGLRLGYLLGPEPVVAALDRVRPPWNVSQPAIAAGLAALQAREHVERGRALVQSERARLTAALEQLGYPVVPSDANFLLMHVGDGAAVRSVLAKRGLIVRDAASFRLPEWIRISIQRVEANDRLLQALAELQASGMDGKGPFGNRPAEVNRP